jgi:hypothetical protein
VNQRILLVLALAVAALAAPASALAVPVAAPAGATAVREYQGTIVFSQFDRATSQWRLAIRRAGQPPQLLPVAPGDREFDADIGPDSNGNPQLIYQRCGETCDLFVYSLSGAGGERPVRNANDPERHDTQPTLWRGRIAWARIYGEQQDRKVVVYTKRLTDPRSKRSTRLPGVPERRCGDSEPDICNTTTGRSVDALELFGDNLAEVVGYLCRGCSGTSQAELRLVRVSTRRSAMIAFQAVGLGGQQLIGPSFVPGGTLAWYKACLGDPEGCRNNAGGPFRYSLSRRTYTKATGPVRVDGFADTGARHYEAVGCNEETGEPIFNAGCRIEEVDAPAYAATRRPER